MQLLKNPPIKVRMLGWESDTFTLSRNGWEIAVDEQPEVPRYGIRFIFKHSHFGYLYAHIKEFDYNRRLPNSIDDHPGMPPEFCYDDLIIETIGPRNDLKEITATGRVGFQDFKLIKAEPVYTDISFQEFSIKDACLFNTKEKPKHQLIVNPNSVPDLLKQIRKIQEPKIMEIRKAEVRARQVIGISCFK